jgi:septation ring formation regulator EzrA
MPIGDEVVWSAVSAAVVGITLKATEYILNRKNVKDDQEYRKIEDFHNSLEDDVRGLRDENRKLREEADKYRQMYNDIVDAIRTRNLSGDEDR